MKFTSGFWMNRPEVTCTNTVQLREIRNEGDRIYIYSVPYTEDSRALGGQMIEIYISSPRPDIFRIQARHFAGSRVKIPEFELNEEPVQLITEESGDVDYYLPQGTWTHLLSSEVREGGAWQKDNYGFFSLPLYARENSIIPFGADNTRPDYDYAENVSLHIFELKDKAAVRICDTHGNEVLKAEAKREDNIITVLLDTLPVGIKVLLRNIDSVKSVSGAVASSDELGTLLSLNEKTVIIEL